MPNNIWIDGYEANQPQRVGSGQVAFELLKNINELDHENNYTILLPSKPFSDLPRERENWKYKILKPAKFWTKLIIPSYFYLTKNKPDLILSPTHYIPSWINCPRINIIFDLSFLRFPKMFKKDDLHKLTKWTKYSAKESEKIITISEASKKDIIKFYGISAKKITVAYPGYDSELYQPVIDEYLIEKTKKKYGIEGYYILFIGTIQPRKNLLRLIRVMDKIDECKLVIAGKIKGKGRAGWLNDEILEEPAKLGISDKIIFTEFVPNEDLPVLLSGSKAFILPSLWEGFGIPVAEAMACGTPVITSNVSSLPEVTGDGGLLVDPESDDQIEQAIRLLVTDKKLHDKLSKRALEQSKKFSWGKMASEVLKVTNSI